MTPGNVNFIKCDRACINNKSKTCEHVLAVDKHIVVLSEFSKWFTSSKSGPSFFSMALVTDKQNVGRKGSKRKKSNMVKPPVVEICNILTKRGYFSIAKRLVSNKEGKSKEQGSRKNITIVRKP